VGNLKEQRLCQPDEKMMQIHTQQGFTAIFQHTFSEYNSLN
jgi:hypothetical protein